MFAHAMPRPFVLSLSKHEWPKTNQLRRGLPGSKLPSFASPKEGNRRKGDPGLPPLRGSLRCSTGQAAAELALRAQTASVGWVERSDTHQSRSEPSGVARQLVTFS